MAVGGGEYGDTRERCSVEIDQVRIDGGERPEGRAVAAQVIGGETDQGLRRDDRRGGERAAEAERDRFGSRLRGDSD